MTESVNTIAQLGGTVFTVVAFLYYLSKNQKEQIQAQVQLAIALENLTLKIYTNTSSNISNTNATNKNTDKMI